MLYAHIQIYVYVYYAYAYAYANAASRNTTRDLQEKHIQKHNNKTIELTNKQHKQTHQHKNTNKNKHTQ